MVNQAKTEVPMQPAVISEATCVHGSIRGATDLIVHGRIEGQVQLDKSLFVQATGVVKADVMAESVIVQGVLVGDIVATQSVQIAAEGRVVGNVSAPRFSMTEGALYRGHVETDEAMLKEVITQRADVQQPAARPVLPFQRSQQAPFAAATLGIAATPTASNFSKRASPPSPPPTPAKLSFKPIEARMRAPLSQPPAPPPPPPTFPSFLLRGEEELSELPGGDGDDLTPQPALIGKRKGTIKRKR